MFTFTQAALDGYIAQFFFPFLRIMAMMAVVPVLGNRAIPARVKIALAVLITITSAPLLPEQQYSAPVDSYLGYATIGREILIGAAMGFTVRLIFAAIEMGGEIAGLQMGLSFAGYIDPSSGSNNTSVSSYFGIMAVLLFLSINGHLLLISGVVNSFQYIPVGTGADLLGISKNITQMGAKIFSVALSISLPIIVTLLVVNIGLGIMSRIAPQLNVFAVGFPISLAVGLCAILLLLPYMERPLRILLEQSTSMLSRI
ncbi:MAG: flagellar biosynthetic protein FliR [Rhodocyclaceae bacterium]|nr:flagellar biosynthetic protein FliR [Rhodocyclaceae bacterium]